MIVTVLEVVCMKILLHEVLCLTLKLGLTIKNNLKPFKPLYDIKISNRAAEIVTVPQ